MKKTLFGRIAAIAICFAMCIGLTAGCAVPLPEPVVEPGKENIESDNSQAGSYDYTSAFFGGISIKSKGAVNGIISTGAVFDISTEKDMSVEELSDLITVTPSVSLTIKKTGDMTFTAAPDGELDSGTLYRFTVGDSENPDGSFVFRTESELTVKSLLPADKAINVPENTGIEIAFSEALNSETDFSAFVSVEPEVKGDFKLYPDGKTLVFIPSAYLPLDTVYTFTVNKGLKGISGKTLAEDITFSFRTVSAQTVKPDTPVKLYTDASELLFNTSESPILKYYLHYGYDIQLTENNAHVSIFKYGSTDDVIAAFKAYEAVKSDYVFGDKAYVFPSEGLTAQGELDIKPSGSPAGATGYAENYLELPALEKGVYLLNVAWSGVFGDTDYNIEKQFIVQITDLVLYTEQNSSNLLLWLNSAATGNVLDGKEIQLEYFNRYDWWNSENTDDAVITETVVTDKDGIAYAELPDRNSAYVTVKTEDDELYWCSSLGKITERQSYMSWMYSDREVYFPNDTVSFNGIVAPGKSGGEKPSKLFYTVGYGGIYYPLSINADGTFAGVYALEAYDGWSITISIYDENKNFITAKYLTVTHEDKPVYEASLSFDNLFYRRGEKAVLTLKASFYDGTPASGLSFNLYGYNVYNINKTVVTGLDGTVSIEVSPEDVNVYGTSPVNSTVYAELIGEESSYLSTSASTRYFHSDLWYDSKRIVPEDGSASYSELYLNKIDTSALKTESDFSWGVYPANIIGAPAEGTVSYKLTQYEYVKVQTGTTYDPITKTTIENYYYECVETLIDSGSKSFVDGVLRLDHVQRPDGFSGYYNYEVTFTDPSNGKTYTSTIYATAGKQTSYNFDYYANYFIDGVDNPYSVNDGINIFVCKEKEEATGGHSLFTLYTDKLELASVAGDNRLSTQYKDSYVTGAFIYVVYFDGKKLHTLGQEKLLYDHSANNNAELTLTPDKEAYKPGETATVTVTMTKDGKPLGGAYVTLSVVDEACFALGEQTVDPLGTYYGLYNYYQVNICNTFSALGNDGGGYGGAMEEAPATRPEDVNGISDSKGSRDAQLRELFLDNPAYKTVYLSNDGTGTITFTVPDNITRWRLTGIGVQNADPALLSGMNLAAVTTDVICTLPFFINADSCKHYITGDDVSCAARVYGSAITGNESVTLTAELYSEDGTVIDTKESSIIAGEYARFNFGKPESGNYYVIIKAGTDEYSDAVKLTFDVIDSGILLTAYKNISTESIFTIRPASYPVNLCFYNAEYDEFLRAADRVSAYYSTRSDCMAAYYVVASRLREVFGECGQSSDFIEQTKKDLSALASHGFIPLLSYSSGDVELTARICAAAPDALTEQAKASLISAANDYIASNSYDSPEQLCAALLILASLDACDITDLYYVRQNAASLTTKAMLYLSAAFAGIGDWTTAADMLDVLISAYGEESEGELSVSAVTPEETLMYTSLALLTAAKADKETAAKLVKYIDTHTSTAELYCLETAAYLSTYKLSGDNTSKLVYKINGETFEKEISAVNNVWLTLTKPEFASLEIISAAENVSVRAAYQATPAEALGDNEKTDKVILEKSITPFDEEKGLYRVTINFTITTDRNYEYFTLTDCIPSGAKYFSSYGTENGDYGDWHVWSYINNDVQLMKGGIFIANYSDSALDGLNKKTFSGVVSYIIRGAVSGEYIAESTICRNQRTGAFALSGRYAVAIGEDGKITLK